MHLEAVFNCIYSLQASFSGVAHTPNVYSQDDLPKAVVRALNQGSNVMSMDFHPQQQTILLGLIENTILIIPFYLRQWISNVL